MKSWTKEGLAAHEGSEQMSVDDAHYHYQLVGVLVHTGSADSGHYYSFIKERDAQRWLCFNDHRVYDFSPDHVPEECFGGEWLLTRVTLCAVTNVQIRHSTSQRVGQLPKQDCCQRSTARAQRVHVVLRARDTCQRQHRT